MTAKLRGFMSYMGRMGPWVCGFVGDVGQEVMWLERAAWVKIFFGMGLNFGMGSKFGVSLKFEVSSKSGKGLGGYT